jgi:hypothetical protein
MDFDQIPARPTHPFDATHLTDEQVAALTPAQLGWADLSETQWYALGHHWKANWKANPLGPDMRPPLEARPERIPAPEDLEKIKSLFKWIDFMHDQVRSPWGMAWIEIELALASLGRLMDWAHSNPPIQPRYRYRIDAPLDPNAQAPDHLPQDWEEP